ncbi:MAG: hypothetical protein KDB94_02760 [Acidobacteria bacterium]|nr:hypothetical protein [Acidobacteriota bacterium]
MLQPEPADGGSTIAEVAAAHEFGTRHVPQRSFIGSTIDGEAAEIERVQAQALDGVVSGRLSAEQAADLVGLDAASRIRETIRSNVPPALAPATAKRKGDSRTLVDKGQLLNSIQHEVDSPR